jgi:hypothetical protein
MSVFACRVTASFDGGLAFARPELGLACGAMGARSSAQLRVAYSTPGWREVMHRQVTVAPGDLQRGYHTVAPCRLADTRLGEGPALTAGEVRPFAVAGRCEIPVEAKSVAVNVTVVQPTHVGHLVLFAGGPPPAASTLNFAAGVTRANNAIVALGLGGALSIRNGMAAGSTHVVLDVVGYFR